MVSARIASPCSLARPVPARRRGEEGYNLAMLIVAITILNIMVAVALPLWSYVIRRDREEETIFRGLQYAEAIRVFRQRNGRYPASLEELVKIEPRSIRQLWTEPLSEDGEFGLVIEAPPQPPAQPGAPGAQPTPAAPNATPPPQKVAVPNDPGGRNASGGFGVGGGGGGASNLIKLPRAAKDEDGDTVGKLTTQGPMAIHGVYLDHQGESLREFFGKNKYEEWTFTAELIAAPVTAPGRPLPRISDDWLGKSFPDGLTPMLGSGSGPTAPGKPGTELGGAGKPGLPGTAPGANDQKGAPEEPQAEPDSPAEFPEEFPSDQPEEVAPDDTMQEEPGDYEPPPDEDIPPPEDIPRREDDANPVGGQAR
jgi:type II secretory pathway pseudopilin PulG